MNKNFHMNEFLKYRLPTGTLYLTVDTSKGKTFTITNLNKGTAPTDLVIDWGDGTNNTVYNNLLADKLGNSCSHTYTGNNIRTITMSGTLKENKDKYRVTYQSNINLIEASGNIFIYSIKTTTIEQANELDYNNSFFQDCTNLKIIDENIFSLCTNIENFFRSFLNCTSLLNIPKKLFRYNIKLKRLNSCFNSCISLKNLPEELFKYNTADVMNFNGFCFGNLKITHIPEDIFINKNTTNVQNCFNSDTNLISIPINLFDNCRESMTRVDYCFASCTNITSAVPDLWNKDKYPNISIYTGCYVGCTKAANYSQIPSGWK